MMGVTFSTKKNKCAHPCSPFEQFHSSFHSIPIPKLGTLTGFRRSTTSIISLKFALAFLLSLLLTAVGTVLHFNILSSCRSTEARPALSQISACLPCSMTQEDTAGYSFHHRPQTSSTSITRTICRSFLNMSKIMAPSLAKPLVIRYLPSIRLYLAVYDAQEKCFSNIKCSLLDPGME